uniref:ADP-ribosylation factor-like protein 6-interacting protein 1 n=1 Tax=Moschus moschiferus TaxID=68415 RepID=A0A8C6E4B7_MOSMO
MAEGDNRSTNLLAAETASLEEQLQGWGEVMLMADKVLRWERAWFPPAIKVTLLLLLPGLNQHGIISKYIGMAKREIHKLLKQKEKKNE